MKLGIAIIVFLAVIIVGLICVLIWVPVSQNDLTESWPVYQNLEPQFSFRYPPGSTVVPGSGDGLHLDEPIDFPPVLVSVITPRVDTFSENGSYGYYETRIRVLAAGDIEHGCDGFNIQASGFDQQVGSTTIAGTTAFIFKRGDGAAGNRVEVIRYALCKDGMGLIIEDVFATGSDGTPLTKKLVSDITLARANNERVVRSIRFVH